MDFREFSWFVASLFLSWDSDPDGRPEGEPLGTRNIIALFVLILVLILVGLRIIDVLRETGTLQDCVMQGRTNCVPSR